MEKYGDRRDVHLILPPRNWGQGNLGTDGTFTGSCEFELGVRPVCPHIFPHLDGFRHLTRAHARTATGANNRRSRCVYPERRYGS
jgi:hypothetical protein